MNTHRPLTVTVAAVLLVLLSVVNLIPTVVPGAGELPTIVVYSIYALGVLGLIAAAGLWLRKSWSMWLTIVVSLVSIVSAAPGIAFAPTTTLWVMALASVLLYAVTIVLVLVPQSRRTYA